MNSAADPLRLKKILTENQVDVLEEWVREQVAAATLRRDLHSDADLRRESAEFLGLLARAVEAGGAMDATSGPWGTLSSFLSRISGSRAELGFTPAETATFVFSLKQPLFSRMQALCAADPKALARELWEVTVLIDSLGLRTADFALQAREGMIRRQQQEMLELSTPVVKIWDGILVLPVIGTLDSARTKVVMESLLEAIVATESEVAILDITGVMAVDTQVAQHLMRTVAAARLMGARCIVCGIRPPIAQTIVHLGVGFGDAVTKANLADALAHAFEILRLSVVARPG